MANKSDSFNTLKNMKSSIKRFLNKPIITSDMLAEGHGDNICGPSLIFAPTWLPNRLGNYYLYFAHHRGKYIRLAFADKLDGPWQIYGPGTLSIEDSAAISDHVASPDAHVISADKSIRMYFHSVHSGTNNQLSFVARSEDGINFEINPDPISNFYMRAIPWTHENFPLRDLWLGMTKGGVMYLSKNGWSNFIKLPVTAFDMHDPMANAPGDVRHVALRFLNNNILSVYYSRIGDAPESILRAQIDLNQPISKWIAGKSELILQPSTNWEGVNLPITNSRSGPAKKIGENALRDPAIFNHENKTYLLYSVMGESGIAIVELIKKQSLNTKIARTSFEMKSTLQPINFSQGNLEELNLDFSEHQELTRLSEPGELAKRIAYLDKLRPINRIFIMGCGRSGTWLLTALFSTMSETNVIPVETSPMRFGLYMTSAKNLVMKRGHLSYLNIDKMPESIKIAYVIRHPFDVLTSHNPTTEKKYHIDPERWLGEMTALKYLIEHKRASTLIIRYEDLVINPIETQTKIAHYFGMEIEKSVDEIISTFSASPEAVLAMHGLRKIDTNSLYKYINNSESLEYLKKIKSNLEPMLSWVSEMYGYNLKLNYKENKFRGVLKRLFIRATNY
jgi:hypothetical protein